MTSTGGAPTTARDDARLAAGEVVAEKYRIEKTIGEGGMGVIYAATNTLTGKNVAIKWMLPRFAEDQQSVARFLREARAAGAIDHPNVVNIYDVGRHGETPFIVMELLRGQPLERLLAKGPIDAAAIISILVPAMRGIAAAHRRGIVHRDLKPDNIFVCEGSDGRRRDTKVLDFGISKAFVDEVELHSVTKTGAIVGTPHYMSPEQVRGKKDLDRRTDVYALGVILFEALTGELPFTADTFTALAVEIATGQMRSLRELAPAVDRDLEDVVVRALARDPEDRWPDVDTLARALERFGNGVRFDDGAGNSNRPPASAEERVVRESAATVSATPSTKQPARGAQPAEIAPPRGADPRTGSLEAPRPRLGLWIALAVIVAVAIAAVAWPRGEDDVASIPTPAEPQVREPVAAEPEVLEQADPGPPQAAEVPAGVEPPPEVVVAPEPTEAPPVERPRVRHAVGASAPETPPAAAGVPQADQGRPRAHGVRTGGVSVDEF